MSTAVLISGHARTFAQCYPTHRWHVYRKLVDPHFFVSVVDDADAAAMELLRQDYANVWIERVTQPTLDEPPHELTLHAPYRNSVPTQWFLRWYWHLNRCFDFMIENTPTTVSFDTFLRVRPDLWFQSFAPPVIDWPHAGEVYAPWWGNYGGTNDRFGYVKSRRAASVYFRAYNHIPAALAAGCPMHPESMLAGVLDLAGIPVYPLNVEFETKRTPLDGRPDVKPVYYAGDIFRYAEAIRGRSPRGGWGQL